VQHNKAVKDIPSDGVNVNAGFGIPRSKEMGIRFAIETGRYGLLMHGLEEVANATLKRKGKTDPDA
jgi:hypothetical protein